MDFSDKPLVTILMPSFNHAKYIGFAIQSALEQTYDNLEFIIIDDGSTDQSVDEIKKYEHECLKRFKRFEWRCRENRGVSRTLNEGLAWAHGQYFTGLSSDDVMFPTKVDSLVNAITARQDVAGVFGGYVEIDERGQNIRSLLPREQLVRFDDVALKRCPLYGISMLMDRRIFTRHGGYDERQLVEDWPTYLRITSYGHSFCTVPIAVTYYRTHAEAFSNNTELLQKERLKALEHYSHLKVVNLAKSLVHVGYATQIYSTNLSIAKKSLRQGISTDWRVILYKKFWRAFKNVLIFQIKSYLRKG